MGFGSAGVIRGEVASARGLLPLQPRSLVSPRFRKVAKRSSAVVSAIEALDAGVLTDAAQAIAAHVPLAYEPIATPCMLMRCGDVVHRSTLDPVLRGEVQGIDWRALLVLAMAGAYLFVPPGVVPGAYDYYVEAPLRRKMMAQVHTKEDVILGKKLATGGFGTVYKGELKESDGTRTPIIIKKAKEFGQAEVYMNERMMRLGGQYCAEFITAFGEKAPKVGNVLDDAVWLLWRYEGDNTLFDAIQKKEFPYNLEPLLLGRELRLEKGLRRKAVTVKLVMKQLLENLSAMHATGIVHRDVKPQNCIVSERDKRVKFIDLGAAADLRIGINYVPSEYLLDPRYAPPQQYIMPAQTPRPPPTPIAALLSPVLWYMERPDKFDMYSAGVTLLQMAFPSLRSDNALIAFNKKLASYNYDLRKWRREETKRLGSNLSKDPLNEGFELLDLNGGAGWELLCSLMAYKPNDRLSAAEALLSPWLGGRTITSPIASVLAAGTTSLRLNEFAELNNFVGDVLKQSDKEGLLSEVTLAQQLGLEDKTPPVPREGSQTIAWWQQREAELKLKADKTKEKTTKPTAAATPAAAPKKGSSGVSKPAVGKQNGVSSKPTSPSGSPSSSFKLPSFLNFGSDDGTAENGAKAVNNGNGNGKANAGKGRAQNGNGNGNGKYETGDQEQAPAKKFDLANVFRSK